MAENRFLESPIDALIRGTSASDGLPELPAVKPLDLKLPERTDSGADFDEGAPLNTNGILPPAQLQPIFDRASAQYGVPTNILAALAQQESSYNPQAVGPSTKYGRAKGLMQNIDANASTLGINPFDPEQSIMGAARQFKERLDKGYSVEEAIAAHHGGDNREQWGPKTRRYAQEVMGKADAIGKGMTGGKQADADPRTKLQSELDSMEPGRYKVLSPEEEQRYQKRDDLMQGGGPGLSDAIGDMLKPSAPSPLTVKNQQRYEETARAPSPVSLENQMRANAGLGMKDTRPYQGFTEATGAQLGNVPERFQQSLAGLMQMGAESLGTDRERYITDRARALGVTPGDYKLLAWAGEQGLIEKSAKPAEALQFIKQNIAQSLTPEQEQQLSAAGIINPQEIAEYAQQWRKDTQKTMNEVRPEPESLAFYGSSAIASLAEMAPMIGAAIITRSPAVASAVMGGQVGGQAYATAREKGLGVDQAQTYAVLTAAAEAAPEALVVGRLMQGGAGAIRRVLEGTIMEGAQEGVTAALQAGIDQQMIDPKMTLSQALVQIRDSMIIGAMAGGAMGAGAAGMDAAASRLPSRQPPAPQPSQPQAQPQAQPEQQPAQPQGERVDPAVGDPLGEQEAGGPQVGELQPEPGSDPSIGLPDPVIEYDPPVGPLSRAAAAVGPTDAERVVVNTVAGPVTGTLESYEQDNSGGWSARVLGDDGQFHQFTAADGVDITRQGAAPLQSQKSTRQQQAAGKAADKAEADAAKQAEKEQAKGAKKAPESTATRPVEKEKPKTWDTLKPGDQVTLYRGENADNNEDGEWWTTDPDKAARYGAVKSFTLPAELVGKHSARGDRSADEFVFPTKGKRPPQLAQQIEQRAEPAPDVADADLDKLREEVIDRTYKDMTPKTARELLPIIRDLRAGKNTKEQRAELHEAMKRAAAVAAKLDEKPKAPPEKAAEPAQAASSEPVDIDGEAEALYVAYRSYGRDNANRAFGDLVKARGLTTEQQKAISDKVVALVKGYESKNAGAVNAGLSAAGLRAADEVEKSANGAISEKLTFSRDDLELRKSQDKGREDVALVNAAREGNADSVAYLNALGDARDMGDRAAKDSVGAADEERANIRASFIKAVNDTGELRDKAVKSLKGKKKQKDAPAMQAAQDEQEEVPAKGPLPVPEEAFGEALSEALESQEEEGIPYFTEPKKVEQTEKRAKAAGVIEQAEADKLVAEWKARAKEQGQGGANANRVVLSLFDASGEWSKPWRDAGYQVHTFDIQTGEDITEFSVEYLMERLGIEHADVILAAPPCTDFSSSGAHAWKKKDADGRTEASVELVRQTLRTVEFFKPTSWAMENPVGRIAKLTGLPAARMSFQPANFGNPYTKRTLLWGDFNTDLPLANVDPVDGSKITDKLSGKDKYQRSLTPEGFAYAYFMANNLEDLGAAGRLAGQFKGIPRDDFQAAVDAGLSEYDARSAVEDAYYDGDLDGAIQALRDAMPEPTPPKGKEPQPEQPAKTTVDFKQAKTVVEQLDMWMALREGDEVVDHRGNVVGTVMTPPAEMKNPRGARILRPDGTTESVNIKDVTGGGSSIVGRLDARMNAEKPGQKEAETLPVQAPQQKAAGAEIQAQGGQKPKRPQYGDPEYSLTDALNDLMEVRAQAESDGMVGDARTADRIRRYEKIVKDLEAQQQEPAKPERPKYEPTENALVSDERAAELRKKLIAKLGQLNSGIDPEIMAIGTELAIYHVERGARTFVAFARNMAADLGVTVEKIRPYLRMWYNGARDGMEDMGASIEGMDGPDEVRAGLAQLDAEVAGEQAPQAEQAAGGSLIDAFLSRLKDGTLPKDNGALRKLVAELDGAEVDNARLKQAQEDLEAALASYARGILANANLDDRQAFEVLKAIYAGQPNLSIRTSTSIENQAYSTPAPLSFLASRLAGIDKASKVYEPTAGNGLLLLTADPKNVTANELEDRRYANLIAQGFDAIQGDALEVIDSGALPEKSQDAIVTNPPFGSLKDDAGKPVKVEVDGYQIGQIDHLIAADALRAMKDDGKAALVLGANKVAGGVSKDDRIFFNWLYSHYNVTGHFEVDGKLYSRQGASWPVRVIAINGRKASNKVSPTPGTVQRVSEWDEVYAQFEQVLGAQQRPAADDSSAGSGKPGAATDGVVAPPRTPAGKAGAPSGGSRGSRGGIGAGNVSGKPAGAGSNQPGVEQQASNGDTEQRPAIGANQPDRLEQGGQPPVAEPASGEGNTGGANAPQSAGNALADAENAFQAKYVARSARKDENVLVPINMAQPLQDALSVLEDAVGNIDQYAMRELGYKSEAELHDALMGLQVDSVASAIYQIKERQKGVVIADQTGIGKGRQAAAVIRWAARNGKIPVFVTVKPQLFTDMYGDLADIGTHDVEPMILNVDEWIAAPDGEKLFSNKKAQHSKTLREIAASGELPAGRNALFMTYSQINTENVQREALRALASRAVFVLDESHNAGGESATGEFVRSVLAEAQGVVYLSATYAKRPDNMPLYFMTDIGAAISDSGGLMEAMKQGGLPLQTVVSNNLVKAGQMFRRERSYEGISIETKVDTANRAAHEQLSDKATSALRAVVEADRRFHEGYVKQLQKLLKEQGEALHDVAGNKASESVNHTEFSSVVHNFVRQMLLGLKAETAAQDAIAALKAGKKPLIALENTMGSFLAEYAENSGMKQGDSLGRFDYRTVLSRALERSRYIVREDAKGSKVKEFIPLSALDTTTRAVYENAQAVIDGLDMDIPVSPLDWIRHRVSQAGYSIAEITGRNLAVDYSADTPTLSQVPQSEQGDKVSTTRAFNDGSLDAIILNVSGSTGISLHASERFKDQRQRHMIVAQPAQDINIFMQMLGRINRTGQVAKPSFSVLNVDLPAEKRPTALLNKKMKSLNANTSSNTESATSIQASDMLNKYGDNVIGNYLSDNVELARALDLSGSLVDENGNGLPDIARKATGRMALMPVQVQKDFYAEVEEQYNTLIGYLNDTNQNDLEPRTFDFEAETLKEGILVPPTDPASPFGQEAVYGEYRIKAQGKQMTADEILAEAKGNLGGHSDGRKHAAALVGDLRQVYADQINAERAANGLGKTLNEEKYHAWLKVVFGEAFADSQLRRAVSSYAADNGAYEFKPEDLPLREGQTFIEEHSIGTMWRVEINGDVYNAAVTNIRNTHKKTGSPFALSKIQVTLAVNGPLRSVTVPASQWKKIEVAPLYGVRPQEAFRDQVEGSQKAKIVTGNLLAAYGELKDTTGTIISFTKKDGSIEQGILLPKKFDYKTNVRGDFQFRSAEDAHKFLREAKDPDVDRFGISPRNPDFRILPGRAGGITIITPASKARGGKYFLDRGLTAITGDFVSGGRGMAVNVPADSAVAAMEYLMRKAPLYTIDSLAPEARRVLGIPEPAPVAPESLARKSVGGSGGATTEQITKAITAGELGGPISKLIESGRVIVHAAQGDLPSGLGAGRGRVQAATGADNIIHMVAGNLSPRTAGPVLLHEAFHAGVKPLVGSERWTDLLSRLEGLMRQAERSKGAARGVFDRALSRVNAADPAESLRVEEFGAYAIEEHSALPPAFGKWVSDVVGAVKAWALSRFGRQLGAVTPAQLRALARAALRSMASDTAQEARQGAATARESVSEAVDWSEGQSGVAGHPGVVVAWPDDLADDGAPYGLSVYLEGDYEAGHITLDSTEDGNFAINEAVVDEPGKGTGGRLYRALVDFLGDRGFGLLSDSQLSPDSQRVYASMQKRGYRVEVVNTPTAGDEGWIRADGPIYRVTADLDAVRFSALPDGSALKDATAALDESPQYRGDSIGELRDDIGRVAKFVLHPRQIAALHKGFTPAYRTAIDQFSMRDAIIDDFQQSHRAYDVLPQKSKERVNAVLELGRLLSMTYGEQDLRAGVVNPGVTVSVRVDESGKARRVRDPINALLSQDGDTITLNDAEVEAYQGLRFMFDSALDRFKQQTLTDFGFPELASEQAAAKELMGMIDLTTPDAQRERLEGIARFVQEIEQAKRTGYVPFARYGDYVVVVKEEAVPLKFVKIPDGGWLVRDLPESYEQFLESIGAEWDTLEGGYRLDRTMRQALVKENERTVHSAKVEFTLADRALSKAGRSVKELPSVKKALAEAEKWKDGKPNRRVVAFETIQKKPEGGLKLSDVDALAEVAMLNTDTWDAVRDQLADAIKGKSFRKHFFQSDNVPGYTADFERAIADYMGGMAGYLSRRHYAHAWDNAISKIEEPRLFDYASKYRAYVNEPQEEMAMLRQVGFFSYIAGVPATAFVNLTQPFLMTLPVLSQIASLPMAAREMARAYKDALKMVRVSKRVGLDFFDPAAAPADVRDDLQRAWAGGMFVPLQTYEVMATARQRNVGQRKAARAFNKTIQATASLFSFAERLNRLVTFIAAARLADKPGVKTKMRQAYGDNALARQTVLRNWSAESLADFMIDETQFRMGKANRPNIMRGMGTVIMQFKGFVMQSLEAWFRLATQNGKQGLKALALSLGAMVALGGVWGMPGGDDLRDVIEKAYKTVTKQDIDLKTELRKQLYEATGERWIAEVASKGATYPFGLDLSRVGMGNIAPDAPLQVFGIPADLFIGRPSRAFQKASNGDALGAVGEFLPNFVKNPITAYGWTQAGVRDGAGRMLLDAEDVSGEAAASKTLGFQPKQITDVRDYEYAQRRMETANDLLKRDYVSKLVKLYARLEKRPEQADKTRGEIEDLLSEIEEHNASASGQEEMIVLSRSAIKTRMQQEMGGVQSTWGRERKQARGASADMREVFGLSEE